MFIPAHSYKIHTPTSKQYHIDDELHNDMHWMDVGAVIPYQSVSTGRDNNSHAPACTD